MRLPRCDSPMRRERMSPTRGADRVQRARNSSSASASTSGQVRSSRRTTSGVPSRRKRLRPSQGEAHTATCAVAAPYESSLLTRSPSSRSRPMRSSFGGPLRVAAAARCLSVIGMLLLAHDLAHFVLFLAVVGSEHVHGVAQVEQARVDARADPLLQRLANLALGAVGPGRARSRVIGREQGGALGVVADAQDLVEDALLELPVLAALADLVDGEDLHLAQGLETFARGEAAREPVSDVREQEEELLVAAADAFAQGELAEHRAEKVRLARPGRAAQEQGADARTRYVLVDEPAGAKQRPGLLRAVAAEVRERAIGELDRQAQCGEGGDAPRIPAAGAGLHGRVAPLVGGEDAAVAPAGRTSVRVGAGLGDDPAVAHREDETFAAARVAPIGSQGGSVHAPWPRARTREEECRGARSRPTRAAAGGSCDTLRDPSWAAWAPSVPGAPCRDRAPGSGAIAAGSAGAPRRPRTSTLRHRWRGGPRRAPPAPPRYRAREDPG